MDKMMQLVNELYRSAQQGEIDYRIGWIASGVSYARNSGRLSGEIELRLRAMGRREARALIMRMVADDKVTMGDVPAYLIQWHYGVPSAERGR